VNSRDLGRALKEKSVATRGVGGAGAMVVSGGAGGGEKPCALTLIKESYGSLQVGTLSPCLVDWTLVHSRATAQSFFNRRLSTALLTSFVQTFLRLFPKDFELRDHASSGKSPIKTFDIRALK
jgi:hypothetical protein